MNYSETQIDALRVKTLENFGAFCSLFCDEGFYDTGYHTPLAIFLQLDLSPNKLIVMPRSFLKTTIASLYALWRATKNPEMRILYVTNSDNNAQKKLQYIMGIVEKNQLYGALYPEVVPNFNRTRWSTQGAQLERLGTYPEATFECAGTRTKIISRHYNLILEDDTVAPDKDEVTGSEVMPSREDIEQAIGWHKLTLPLLVNPTDERIVLGTRWCYYDLIQHIIDNEATFKYLNIPAYREDGSAAYSRYSSEVLANTRSSLGTYMFNALYLNSPITSEHYSFNRSWIRHTNEAFTDGTVKITVDPAISQKKSADYTVVLACRHTPGRMVVEAYRRAKMKPSMIVEATLDLYKAFPDVSEIIIESIAFQKALVDMMQEEARKRKLTVMISEFRSKQKKEARIYQLAPHLEGGRILLREGMGELEGEMLEFPYGAHDDILDALAMQLPYYTQDYSQVKEVKVKRAPFSIQFDDVLKSLEGRRRGGYAYL